MSFVILGISGGVDSSVSARLLHDMGHRVLGVYFVMHDTHLGGIENARRAARDSGIEFDCRDLREEFRNNVISPFLSEYLNGRTPNPCVFCNKTVKFPYLLKYAEEAGADFIATGHYASVEEFEGNKYIARGADIKKDQSYFLYPLSEQIIGKVIFPLAGLTKDEVRELAAGFGLCSAEKKDSQDICFIPDGDSGAFVKTESSCPDHPGDFLFTDGKKLGRHQGIFNYTVGQRRGLGIASDAPLYVMGINPSENTVLLGRENDLYRDRIKLRDVILPTRVSFNEEGDFRFTADVCIRYSKKTSPAEITLHRDFTAEILFETPQRAPAPGQSAVFYQDNRVAGGGTIC